MRDNGAIEGASDGFAEDDEVILMVQMRENEAGNKIHKVIGHKDGVKSCEFYIKCTFNGFPAVKRGEVVRLWDGTDGEDKIDTSAMIYREGGVAGPFKISANRDVYPYVYYSANGDNIFSVFTEVGTKEEADVEAYYIFADWKMYGEEFPAFGFRMDRLRLNEPPALLNWNHIAYAKIVQWKKHAIRLKDCPKTTIEVDGKSVSAYCVDFVNLHTLWQEKRKTQDWNVCGCGWHASDILLWGGKHDYIESDEVIAPYGFGYWYDQGWCGFGCKAWDGTDYGYCSRVEGVLNISTPFVPTIEQCCILGDESSDSYGGFEYFTYNYLILDWTGCCDGGGGGCLIDYPHTIGGAFKMTYERRLTEAKYF